MDLIDRYVLEIRQQLPREKANDIAAEIDDDLRSQVEAREAVLGRPLDDVEIGELLRRYGNPYIVAYRYRPQQFLVGPALMPFFWRTYGALVVAFIYTELWLSNSAAELGHPFNETLNVAFHSAVWIFAIVVLAFAGIERYGNPEKVASWFSRWDPRSLPANADERFYVPRFTSGAETIVNTMMLYIVFTLLRDWRGIPLLQAPSVKFAVVGLVFSLVSVAFGALHTYTRPWAGRIRLAAHVIGYAAVVIGCALSLHAGLFGVNQWLGYGAVGAIVVSIIAGGMDAWKLLAPRGVILSAAL